MVQAPPLFYRGKVCYSGFATVAVSENQVNVVLEKVRRLVGPLASMSYALRMSMDDNSDIVEFSDDDGVFGAGYMPLPHLPFPFLSSFLYPLPLLITLDYRPVARNHIFRASDASSMTNTLSYTLLHSRTNTINSHPPRPPGSC